MKNVAVVLWLLDRYRHKKVFELIQIDMAISVDSIDEIGKSDMREEYESGGKAINGL